MENDISKINEELLKSRYSIEIGGAGGEEFSDPDDYMREGPITHFELRHGAEIDNIRLYYGGVPGPKHGGSAGTTSIFEIKPDYHIFRIKTRAGERVDQLQFLARSDDPELPVQLSPVFGQEGAHPDEIVVPEGLALRSISGRAGGRIDMLRFHFGYLARIDYVHIDEKALAAKVKDVSLKVLDTLVYDNGTDLDSTATFRRELSFTNRIATTWGATTSYLYGHSIKATASVLVLELEEAANFQFEASLTYGQTSETETTEVVEWTNQFPVPAQRRTTVTVSVFEKNVKDVPFYYDIVLYEVKEGAEIEHFRFPQSGTFSGAVTSRAINASVKAGPIPVQPLTGKNQTVPA